MGARCSLQAPFLLSPFSFPPLWSPGLGVFCSGLWQDSGAYELGDVGFNNCGAVCEYGVQGGH